ncbi:NAD-dependent epimerase/dehydratase family protein [Paenibacillus sp. H1-7]|uniref:NAD-dependent epimerase/dehydratase family protein n=1 Tax=Paenibacillus sp. H1-7 TaxID=2282849 RepID=UPI001EF8C98A|nr:NAD-dependent epimerase/dehydratase family protein [Paenibacillus sp. H1-7]ULL19401.1 NAD-dependent epimerase/dehydratase family protein [Paenibacillus sp. H1-7]
MRILITGKNGYVGLSLQRWLSQWNDKYIIDTIDVRTEDWKNEDFSKYDALFHAAAVVHKYEKPHMKDYYYKVNRDLTIELAMKAKQSGIKQFIFMSSMSVYGLEGIVNQKTVIDQETVCKPNSEYGRSKLAAELELNKLDDPSFGVAIVRAPMIYGPDCPGNYGRLKKLVLKTPIAPLMDNQRSMIFVDNLSEFIRLILVYNDRGIFFPQNRDFVNTTELIKLIALNNARKVIISKLLGLGVKLIGSKVNTLNKVFGNLVFEKQLSNYRNFEYCVADLTKSVEITEMK